MYNVNIPSQQELPTSSQLLRSTVVAIVAATAILVTIVFPSEYGFDPTGAGRALGLTEMGVIKKQLAEEAEADRQMAAGTLATQSAKPAQTLQDVDKPAQVEPRPVERPVDERINSAESQAVRVPNGDTDPIKPVITDSSTETVASTPTQAEPVAEPGPWRDRITITLEPGKGAEVKLVMKAGVRARFEWTANGSVLNYDTHGDGGGRSISYEKGRGVASDKGVIEAAFDGNHGWFWRNRTNADVTMTLSTSGAYRKLKRVL